MVTVNDMLKRWRLVKVEKLAQESVDETSEDYAKINAEQMYAGKLKTGQDIKPTYKPSTVAYKKRKGRPYDRVTLRDRNNFQPAIKVKLQGGRMEIDSDVDYAKYLEKKYTKNIYGLNDEFRPDYLEIYGGVLRSKISHITGLKFK
jgi:hypothetical protein